MTTRLRARGRWGWPIGDVGKRPVGRVRPQRDGFRALAHQEDGVVRLLGLFDSRSRAAAAVETADRSLRAEVPADSRVACIPAP